jgi:4-methyl-5(b-hydroxyethyl)-thiazole monophosphate biosynthesis
MKALVPIANGCEEMEAVIIIDTLRRAEWDVTVAGLTAGTIEASRGVKLVPDAAWEQINPAAFDVLLLPGGFGGTQALCAHKGVQQALRDFDAKGKWVGSICAAALALNEAGILEGKKFTCYPGVEQKLPANIQPVDEIVVVDGHLITSQGPGTAFEFALKVIAECSSPNKSAEVRAGLLL